VAIPTIGLDGTPEEPYPQHVGSEEQGEDLLLLDEIGSAEQ
jgi:hypothetical protein